MSTMTCLRVVPAAVASARRAASPRASGAPGRALHAARARAPDAKVRSGPPETAPRLEHDRVRRAPLRPRRASSARPILPFSARRAARFPRPPVPAAPPDGKIYPFQFKPEPDAFRVPTLTPTRLPSSPSHSPALPSAASVPLARPLPGASPRFRRCARVLPRRRREARRAPHRHPRVPRARSPGRRRARPRRRSLRRVGAARGAPRGGPA